MYAYFQDPDFYGPHLEAIEGSVEGVAELRRMGHDVRMTTSCYFGMVDQKARWLEAIGVCRPNVKWAGLLSDDLVVLNTKDWADADLVIDDAAHTIARWATEKRRRAIMMEYPHNADLDLHSMHWQLVRRARSWADIVRLVGEM